MGKLRFFYDAATLILLFLISALVGSFFASEKDVIDIILSTWGLITLVVMIFYAISVIILGIRHSQKFSHGLAIFVGSIVFFFILPLIYYLTYLRKLMGAPTPKEQMKKLLKAIQKDPELVS